MTEQLTDDERASLAATDQTTLQGRSGTKALRVLDAHAAGVAALVQDRNEWQQVSRDWRYRAETAEAELRQQKEDRAALVTQLEAAKADAKLMRQVNAKWEEHFGHMQWVEAVKVAESHLETANRLLEWHRGLLDELRQLCFDTDADPKPQWNAARDMNCLLTIGQKIDAARAGCQTPAPTHAALVAQLEAARNLLQDVWDNGDIPRKIGLRIQRYLSSLPAAPDPTRAALVAQVAELTRERDEAREQARCSELNMQSSARSWRAEVTRLTEALAAAQKRAGEYADDANAAEARARELDTECTSHVQDTLRLSEECATLRAEVQKERDRRVEHRQMNQSLNEQVAAAQKRVSELESGTEACPNCSYPFKESAAESSLAAANALLVEAQDSVHSVPGLRARIDAHLAAQPATAPARDAAEQVALDALCDASSGARRGAKQ